MAINSPIFPSQQPSRNGHKYEGPELLFGIAFCWEPLVAGCWKWLKRLGFLLFFHGRKLWRFDSCDYFIAGCFFVLCLFSASSCCFRKTNALEFHFVLLVLLVSFLKFVSCQMHETLHLVRVMPCKMLWAEWGSLALALGDGKPLGPPVVAGAIFGTLFVFATKLMGSRNL